MPGGLNAILDYLKIARKNSGAVKDAFDAGYTNIVHRSVGDIDNPALKIRKNANIGAHADLAGGKQAKVILDALNAGGLPNPGMMTLLARANRPYFMTDEEVNTPIAVARALADPELEKAMLKAKLKHRGKMVNLPLGKYDNPDVPLHKILSRWAAENALRRRGYDTVLYPNEIEGAVSTGVAPSVWESPAKREELAKVLWENASPDPDAAQNKWFNPAMTTIDYSNYRNPFGELLKRRDFKSVGYATGGLVGLRRG